MKKLIAALVSASMLLSGFSAFAEPVVKINYDFDGNAVGTWSGISGCGTVAYPDESNNCLVLPTGSTSQITHTPGASNAYYGKTVYSGDFYPMDTKMNVNIFLRYIAADSTSSSFVDNRECGIVIDGSGIMKTANKSTIIGTIEPGTKYSYKAVNDEINRRFDVYMNGIWNGTEHPQPDSESNEYPGYEFVGSYSYPETWGPVGGIYVYNNTGVLYVDNIRFEAPDITCTTTDFEEGSTEITFNADQFIDTSTIQKLKLSRVGADGTAELVQGTDYTVSWGQEMTNFARAALPTITFAEPVGGNEQIIFDFSEVKDSYGRTLESMNTALPRNPDSEAINAAYDMLNESWLTDETVKSLTVEAPSELTPIDGGSTVLLEYTINSDNEKALELIKNMGRQIEITQPEVDDAEAEPSSFDVEAEISVKLLCGSQPEKTITRKIKIVRRKLLDEAAESADEIIKAVSDDDDSTAWEPEGGRGELTLSFAEPKAIGGVIAKGEYSEISYSVSEDGTEFKPVEQFPVRAKYFKASVTGTKVTELEPVTSEFFEDVIFRAEDLANLEYNQSLTNLTSGTYLTFPNKTPNGTPLSWSTSNRNVIDEYGTITQTSQKETVTITAKAVDSKGNVIETASREFTATVAAKVQSTGSSGVGSSSGKGGGSYTAPLVPTPTPLPTPTPAPSEGEAMKFSDTGNVPWAEEAIENLAGKGIINGKTDGIFAPNDSITREEFVKIIVSAFGIPDSGNISFGDVPDDAWFTRYIRAAADAGIVGGISADSFGVGMNITRQDMAVIFKRTADYRKLSRKSDTELPELSDIDSAADYAREAVEEMLLSGVINGSGGMLNPAKNATRAEAAVMMYRFINNYQ